MPEPSRPAALSTRVRLHFHLAAAASALAAGTAAWFLSPPMVAAAALATGLTVGLWAADRPMREVRRALRALEDGVKSFRDRDYSLSLAVDRRDEVGRLLAFYNEIGETLRDERSRIRQKEVMLDTVLRATPLAIVLADRVGRVVYANRSARDLFAPGERLVGRDFAEILAVCPPSLRQLFAGGADSLFTAVLDGQEETFHLARRAFQLNMQDHSLYMVKRLTAELRRQEVEIWKKVIRLMSHELNNSLAPISSLAHSARRILADPSQAHHLQTIFDTIEDRTVHLKEFLEGYARFARLPRPRKEAVAWGPFLERLERVNGFRFRSEPPPSHGFFDPSQMQQVLINLLKNAREAGGPDDEVSVAVEQAPSGGARIRVEDRGSGMQEDVLRSALLPFYSSKPSGMGLGLPLCREIIEAHGGWLRIQNRQGGGVAVTCWIPPA